MCAKITSKYTTKSYLKNSLVYGKITLGNNPTLHIKTTNSLELCQTSPFKCSLNTIWGRQVFAIKKTAEGILLQPDIYGSLPIYAYNYQQSLYIANNFHELLSLIPTHELPELNQENIIQFLMKEPPYSGETVLSNLRVYNGDNQLLWNGVNQTTVPYKYPDPSMPSTAQINDIFEKNLSWTGKYKENEIGVTLSGGVDSAVVFVGLCQRGIKPVALSIIYPGAKGERQRRKLSQIIRITNSKWITVNSPTNYAFDSSSIDLYRSLYAKLNTQLASKARKFGVKIIATGLGGDQLAYNAGYNGCGFTFQKKLPRFITKTAMQTYISLPQSPETNQPQLISKSALNTAGITGELGFEHDLWTENPLCYYDFWHWSQSLPKQWGSNKNGMRDYLRKFGFSEIANTTSHENYQDIYYRGVKNVCKSKLFRQLITHSILEKWQWVDTELLLKSTKQNFSKYSPDMQYILSIYELENFLQWYTKLKGGS